MRHAAAALALALLVCLGCAESPPPEHRATPEITVELGDSHSEVIEKMHAIGATDMTDGTKWSYMLAQTGEQKYIWWKLPGNTVVVMHLGGSTKDDLTVDVIEIGEQGKGIANWRSQELKTITSRPPPPWQR